MTARRSIPLRRFIACFVATGALMSAGATVVCAEISASTSTSANAAETANQTKQTDAPSRAWLGIQLVPLPPALAAQLKLQPPESHKPGQPRSAGLLVTNIAADGPADRAGILLHDVVTFTTDAPPGGEIPAFAQKLAVLSPGQQLPLTLLRAGDKKRVTCTLTSQPAKIDYRHGPPTSVNASPGSASGGVEVAERIQVRGVMLRRAADGQWEVLDPRQAPQRLIEELPAEARTSLDVKHDGTTAPGPGDAASSPATAKNALVMKVSQRRGDGSITIEEERSGQIRVTRTIRVAEAAGTVVVDAVTAGKGAVGTISSEGTGSDSRSVDLRISSDGSRVSNVASQPQVHTATYASVAELRQADADAAAVYDSIKAMRPPLAARLPLPVATPPALSTKPVDPSAANTAPAATPTQTQHEFQLLGDGSIEVRVKKPGATLWLSFPDDAAMLRDAPNLHAEYRALRESLK